MVAIAFKRTYSVIKESLLKLINKDFLVFLFFLAMSAGFWLLMTFNETYEREVRVGMQIVNIPDNVVITDPLPDTIRVTLRDKGYTLLPYMYGDLLQSISIPFPIYAKQNGKGAITTNDLQRLIRSMLYSSTKIVSIKAEKLDFQFNYGLSKKVPILLDGNVKTADKYYLARTGFSPDSAIVYASREKLDSIKEVYTEFYEREELNDTSSVELRLRKISGAKISPSSVKTTFYADVLTEKTIEVPITAINLPNGLLLRTFPGHVNVKVVVGRSHLGSVRPEYFRVVADYKDVANHPSDKCNIYLRTVPKGIIKTTLETQQVDYLIENIE